MTKTARDRVLDHLEKYKTITSWEAIQNYMQRLVNIGGIKAKEKLKVKE